jgi:hypothetical protein
MHDPKSACTITRSSREMLQQMTNSLTDHSFRRARFKAAARLAVSYEVQFF